ISACHPPQAGWSDPDWTDQFAGFWTALVYRQRTERSYEKSLGCDTHARRFEWRRCRRPCHWDDAPGARQRLRRLVAVSVTMLWHGGDPPDFRARGMGVFPCPGGVSDHYPALCRAGADGAARTRPARGACSHERPRRSRPVVDASPPGRTHTREADEGRGEHESRE